MLERQSGNVLNKPLARLGIATFLTVNVVMFTMVLWSNNIYAQHAPAHSENAKTIGISPPEQLSGSLDDVFRWLALLLSTPVLALLAGPLLANSWQELRRGVAAVDLLVVLGVVAAFFYSAVSVVRGHGHIYFEVACVVLVLVTLGRWFESVGKLRATQSLDSLSKLVPQRARRSIGGAEEWVSISELRRGDSIRILPGERIPADGEITRGKSTVDEQVITGESQPVLKCRMECVHGGTLNLDSELEVRVHADGGHGAVQRLLEAVQQARHSRGGYQILADRIASVFLPIAIAISLATLAWHSTHSGFEDGILAGLSVLLIACPCALGLATPMAVWLALGRAAQNQVLFRHGNALERLAQTKSMFFDKTGTLSYGDCEVVAFDPAPGNDSAHVLHIAVALAAKSNHPFSKAICQFAAGSHHELDSSIRVQERPGRGLLAFDAEGNCKYSLGNRRLIEEMKFHVPNSLRPERQNSSEFNLAHTLIGCQGEVRGMFRFVERLRPELPAAFAGLRGLGIELEVLSGDTAARAAAIGELLQVPVRAELLPEEKSEVLQAVKCAGRGGIAMVGDGMNDAPALASADVGIALGCGAEISREAADICLLGNDLSRLPWAIELARQTVQVIRQNLFWAFIFNIGGIGLAVTGHLNPIWASAAMMVSSFLVLGNSSRLAGTDPSPQPCETVRRQDSPRQRISQDDQITSANLQDTVCSLN